jgi:hypothetical protein
VTRCGDVATLAGGEAATERGKGGNDASWADANLTGLKNEKKIRTIDSVAINGQWRFKSNVELIFLNIYK